MNLKKIAALAAVVCAGSSLVGCDVKGSFGVGFEANYADGTCTVNAAAVTFDAKGKVVECKLDSVQSKVVAGTEDIVEFSSTNAGLSKQELGDNYHMKLYGSSISEVDEEINAFADWCKGKNVETIKATLGEQSTGHYQGSVYTTDADLWTKCTITINSYVEAIEQAYKNAKKATFAKDATVGLKLSQSLGDSGHKGYNYEDNIDITAVVVKDSKVVSAWMDTVVFTFSAGLLLPTEVTDIKYIVDGKYASKKTIGDAYAMYGASYGSTLAEWDDQALAIENALVGKTSEEVGAITEISGATITYSYYLTEFQAAIKYAGCPAGTRLSTYLAA